MYDYGLFSFIFYCIFSLTPYGGSDRLRRRRTQTIERGYSTDIAQGRSVSTASLHDRPGIWCPV